MAFSDRAERGNPWGTPPGSPRRQLAWADESFDFDFDSPDELTLPALETAPRPLDAAARELLPPESWKQGAPTEPPVSKIFEETPEAASPVDGAGRRGARTPAQTVMARPGTRAPRRSYPFVGRPGAGVPGAGGKGAGRPAEAPPDAHAVDGAPERGRRHVSVVADLESDPAPVSPPPVPPSRQPEPARPTGPPVPVAMAMAGRRDGRPDPPPWAPLYRALRGRYPFEPHVEQAPDEATWHAKVRREYRDEAELIGRDVRACLDGDDHDARTWIAAVTSARRAGNLREYPDGLLGYVLIGIARHIHGRTDLTVAPTDLVGALFTAAELDPMTGPV
jgi:hypothetical protein